MHTLFTFQFCFFLGVSKADTDTQTNSTRRFFFSYLEHLLLVKQSFRAEAVRKAKHQTDYSWIWEAIAREGHLIDG